MNLLSDSSRRPGRPHPFFAELSRFGKLARQKEPVLGPECLLDPVFLSHISMYRSHSRRSVCTSTMIVEQLCGSLDRPGPLSSQQIWRDSREADFLCRIFRMETTPPSWIKLCIAFLGLSARVPCSPPWAIGNLVTSPNCSLPVMF